MPRMPPNHEGRIYGKLDIGHTIVKLLTFFVIGKVLLTVKSDLAFLSSHDADLLCKHRKFPVLPLFTSLPGSLWFSPQGGREAGK